MRHSSLTTFLNGQRPAEELWREIEAEVSECVAACAKGGSGTVSITDGPGTQVAREHVAVLLTALAEAKLPLVSADYIADALIMSDGFRWEDDAVAEALFFLSDESGSLTLSEVEDAQSRLPTAQ